jgi:hypothetical protein
MATRTSVSRADVGDRYKIKGIGEKGRVLKKSERGAPTLCKNGKG